ncbi:MAG: 3-dehydroquinate synthase [Flavobacteriaceae bacterium]|nr:3-dehydroquinate synthase [Flavobacteriaceae bacterium]
MPKQKNIGNVHCGTAVGKVLSLHLQKVNHSSIFVLTDTNTRRHCLPKFLSEVTFESEPVVLEMPAGEHHKNIDSCVKIWSELSEKNADRNSLLINLGGGVVTDLGGFVASTFKRGIDFINIPTSLLAMVDAAVGGKTGVDLGSLKNQVGVINHPSLVLLDPGYLQTLPEAHLRSGQAEMLKHGIIASEVYFDRTLEFDINKPEAEELIWESVLIKDRVVKQDPLEKGLRKILNYGHTLGHAIESHALRHNPDNPLLHGEAIAIGMILATYISSEMLGFPKKSLDKITAGILAIFKKQLFSKTHIKEISDLLIYDKKSSRGKVYFVLLNDFADHKINCEVPDSLISEAFSYYSSHS